VIQFAELYWLAAGIDESDWMMKKNPPSFVITKGKIAS